MTLNEQRLDYHTEMMKLLGNLQHHGDFDAHAASIRQIAKTVLFLLADVDAMQNELKRVAQGLQKP